MTAIRLLLLMVVSYLIGSIPTGFIMARVIGGINIRKYGSGNVGATNVMRILGTVPGFSTLAIDILKGLLTVAVIAPTFCPEAGNLPVFKVMACLSVVAGHNWMIFLGFRGGKGVATTGGAFLALTPLPTVCAFAVFGIVVLFTRYVSLGSIAAGICLALFIMIFREPIAYRWFSVLIVVAIVFKHRSNIKRLIAGTEKKLGDRKESRLDEKTEEG